MEHDLEGNAENIEGSKAEMTYGSDFNILIFIILFMMANVMKSGIEIIRRIGE